MQKKDVDQKPQAVRPVAILVSDIHLSHSPPACRSFKAGDPIKGWYDTMAHYLEQLRHIASSVHPPFDLPIICAGDLFDRWNCQPELINFAMEHVPHGMYCIPGQHDLPYHDNSLIHKSAYWTLAAGHVIQHLSENSSDKSRYPCHPIETVTGGILYLWPCKWGEKPESLKDKHNIFTGGSNVAVIHGFCYAGKVPYPGASFESGLTNGWSEHLKGYSTAVFGDNHMGFSTDLPLFVGPMKGLNTDIITCNVFNCGTFMRRKSDEISYRPQVGILREDGTVETRLLDTEIDQFVAPEEGLVEDGLDLSAFLKELRSLGDSGLDFQTSVQKYIEQHRDELTDKTKDIILRSTLSK